MWKKLRPLFVLLSVALNVAFVVIWAAHAVPTHLRAWRGPAHEEGVWCPLHRRLGATEAQWREIEPRLVKFQESARLVCNEVNRLRGEMIDLVAAPDPDTDAIRAKQEEILAGQRHMQQLVIEHLLNEKKLLHEDQQRRLFEMLRRRSGCAGHGPMMGRAGMGTMCPAGAEPESKNIP